MKMLQFNSMPQQAFTLVELLVSLAVVGTLSVLFVPKLLGTVAQNNNDYLLKETIVASTAMLEESLLIRQPNLMRSAVERMSTIRNCGDDDPDGDGDVAVTRSATGNGCWNEDIQDELPANVQDQGVITKKGVAIVGFHKNLPNTTQMVQFIMDANGEAHPNVEGRDQIRLVMCTTNAFCTTNVDAIALAGQGYKATPGRLMPATAQSATLFNRLFPI